MTNGPSVTTRARMTRSTHTQVTEDAQCLSRSSPHSSLWTVTPVLFRQHYMEERHRRKERRKCDVSDVCDQRDGEQLQEHTGSCQRGTEVSRERRCLPHGLRHHGTAFVEGWPQATRRYGQQVTTVSGLNRQAFDSRISSKDTICFLPRDSGPLFTMGREIALDRFVVSQG